MGREMKPRTEFDFEQAWRESEEECREVMWFLLCRQIKFTFYVLLAGGSLAGGSLAGGRRVAGRG